MFLKSLKPLKYGPFHAPTELEVEPDVTVLTGPNDTGKSALLRLIARISSGDGSNFAWSDSRTEESEYNLDSHHEIPTTWDKDPEFGAIATFRVDKASSELFLDPRQFGNAEEVTIKCGIAPQQSHREAKQWKVAGQKNAGSHQLGKMPRAILLPPSGEVRNTIELKNPTPVERNLLYLAFGSKFSFDQLASLSVAVYQRQVGQARLRLNEWLRRCIPPSVGLEFELLPDAQKREILTVSIRDAHGGFTPLGSRGSGVRRVMTLLAALMANNFDVGHFIILVDEPETSLHADSQHLVRRLLEGLAERPNIQVIYATHSPSMVNVLRPHSIRLLRRTSVNGVATSVVDNRPFKGNFLPVRSSLGLTPADSLLYALLTVVVEGDTEVVGLPLLLAKLTREGVKGFEQMEELLSQAHILDGMGDNFSYMCGLAKSQGAKPVIFLDGDKKRHLKKYGLEKEHPDVPVVTLDDGKEFEQLVPEDIYFQAVAEVVEAKAGQITSSAFQAWQQTKNLPEKMVFTKRVERWLEEQSLPDLDKVAAMRKAVELVKVEDIHTPPLLKLVEHMGTLLKG